MAEFVEVTEADKVPVGKGRPFTVAGKELALFNVDGTIYAIDDGCLHHDSSLASGTLQGKIVICPAHGWRYDAHERTLLAWVRTATSLITFGFSIQQFFRIARAGAPPDERLIGPQEFGFLMMVIGLAALALSVLQNRADVGSLRARYPAVGADDMIPRSRARILAALVALLGIIAVISMILRQ